MTERRAQALKMMDSAKSIFSAMPRDERALYTIEKLTEIRSEFSRLSERWSALTVGDDFTEQW